MLTILDKIKIKYRHLILPYECLINIAIPYQSILDIGCGLAMFLEKLSGHGKKLNGIDISELTIQKAKEILKEKNIKDITLSHFNGNPNTIFNLKDYDAIFLNDVLHHIPAKDQSDFLKKIYKRMKKGSQFIIKDIDASNPLVIFNKIHDIILNKQYPHEQSIKDCYFFLPTLWLFLCLFPCLPQ